MGLHNLSLFHFTVGVSVEMCTFFVLFACLFPLNVKWKCWRVGPTQVLFSVSSASVWSPLACVVPKVPQGNWKNVSSIKLQQSWSIFLWMRSKSQGTWVISAMFLFVEMVALWETVWGKALTCVYVCVCVHVWGHFVKKEKGEKKELNRLVMFWQNGRKIYILIVPNHQWSLLHYRL